MTILAIIGTMFLALNVGLAMSRKEYHSAAGWSVATLWSFNDVLNRLAI